MVGEGSQTERETIERAGVLYAADHAVELSPASGIKENPFQRLQGFRW